MHHHVPLDIYEDGFAGHLNALIHSSGESHHRMLSSDGDHICHIIQQSKAVRFHGYISHSLLQTIRSAISVVEELEFVCCPAVTYNDVLSSATRVRGLAFTRLDLSNLEPPRISHLVSVRFRECCYSREDPLPLRATTLELVVPYDLKLLQCLPASFSSIFIYGDSVRDELHLPSLPYAPNSRGFYGHALILTLEETENILRFCPARMSLTQSRILHGGSTKKLSSCKLQALNLQGTIVSSFDFLQVLACIQDCEEIELPKTLVSQSVLLELARLQNLKELDFSSSGYRAGNLQVVIKSVREVYISERQQRHRAVLLQQFPNAKLSVMY